MSNYLKSQEIESRTYQEVIAASARDKNTLVVLPTGLGKTVIAAMVASAKLDKGKILFLAPTRPLVEQHRKTFNQFLDINEDEMTLMTGSTRPEKRYKLWKEKKAFFATPQVVENDLISDQIPEDEFSLIIFDEAHRATGEYSYVFISEKMRNCQRLALTASPGGEKEKIMTVAENLQINNFEVRTEDDPDVKPFIEDKEINWSKVALDNSFEKAKEHMEKAYRKQIKKLKSLGVIDRTSNFHKGDLLKIRGEISSKLSTENDPKLYSAISRVATALKISQALELLETQGVSQCYEYLRGLETDESKAASRALSDKDMQQAKSLVTHLKKKGEEHPKIDKLREILSEMSEDEKAIVFTEYRKSAEKITEELNIEGLDAVKFIGQQGEEGMSQKKQIETLSAFQEGEYNVIVSTSIGEEGLDIPAVDYVVFYEPVASGIRDIQRRGRTGRQESGKVYVLMAENTRDEGHYWSAHHKKKNMNKVLKQLKQEDLTTSQKTLQKYGSQETEKKDEDKIEIYIDDRENSIAKKLSKKEIKLHKKRLKVGDVIVSDRVAVERKKTEDFVDSLLDNRLFEQAREIKQFEKPIIIIEGQNLYKHRDVHPNAIRGAITSITVDYEIPIIWSEDKDETVELVTSIAKREQKDNQREVSIRGQSNTRTQKELQEFIVAGLPGVNTKIARRLLSEFGTIQKVFTAETEELKSVEGIGDKKANKIKSLLKQDYSNPTEE